MIRGRVGGGRGRGAALCSLRARLTGQIAKDVGESAPTVNGKAEGRGHGAVAGNGLLVCQGFGAN